MKTSIPQLALLLMLAGFQARAQKSDPPQQSPIPQECTVARVISEGVVSSNDSKNSNRTVLSAANGIALTPKVLIVPDHFVVADSRSVKVLVEATHRGSPITESFSAQVIARDHHFDVALVELETGSTPLVPCELSPLRDVDLSNVALKGFKDLNTHLIRLPVGESEFFDSKSKNLEVPGIEEALEFKFHGGFPTLSGSPLTSNGTVIGIVNAIGNNSAYAVYAADVFPVARELLREFARAKKSESNPIARIDRNYIFNPLLEQFEFSGLIVRGGDQVADPELVASEGTAHKPRLAQRGEGTAHRAEGTAHRSIRSRIYGSPDFSNIPVSGGNRLGFVVARVNPKKKDEFKARHPELAARLENSVDNTIRIYKIDGQPVGDIFSLLRVLASASAEYRISEAVTRFQAENLPKNDYAASVNDLQVLMQKIIDNPSIAGDLKIQVSTKLKELIGVLSRLDREFIQSQHVNSGVEDQAVRLWESMDSASGDGALYQLVTNRLLGAEEVALRNSIRGRAPFNSVF